MDETGAIYDQRYEQRRLAEILERYYMRVLRAVHELVASALGLDASPTARTDPNNWQTWGYYLDDPSVRQLLLEAAWRVVRIDETTRRAISEMIRVGHERGYSLEQIANGVPDDGYRGLSGLFRETWRGRAQTVARTELGHATLMSAQNRYRATGLISEMEILDGVDDDDACRSRNGKRVPVSTTVELNHPNCRVAVVPIVEVEE